MTITTETSRSGPYAGDGAQTVFAYSFKIDNAAHLTVTLTSSAGVDAVQTLATHYTVSGVGNASGGNVTMITAPATGEMLTITRGEPFTQSVDLVNQGAFLPDIVETALDGSVKRDQELAEGLGRAIKVARGDSVPAADYLAQMKSVLEQLLALDLATAVNLFSSIDLADYDPDGAPVNDIARLRSAFTEAISKKQFRVRIGPGAWTFNGIVKDIPGADKVSLDIDPQAIIGGSNDLKLTKKVSVGAHFYAPAFDKQACIYDAYNWHYAHQPSVNVGIDNRATPDEATNPNLTAVFNSSPNSEVESDGETRKVWVSRSTDFGATWSYPVSMFDDAAYTTNPASTSVNMGQAMVFRHPDNKEWIGWNHPLGGDHGGPIVAELTDLAGKLTHVRFCQDTQNPEYIYETAITGTLASEIAEANRTNNWIINGITWRCQIQDWYTALDGAIFAWLSASATATTQERLFSLYRRSDDPAKRWRYGPFIPLGTFANMDTQFNEWSAFEVEAGSWMAVIRNTNDPGTGPDGRGERHGVSFSSDGINWTPIEHLGTQNHEERMQAQRISETHQAIFLPGRDGQRRAQSMQIRRAGGGWSSNGLRISTEGDKPPGGFEWRQIIDTNSLAAWSDLTSVSWTTLNASVATDAAATPVPPAHIVTDHGLSATQAYLFTATAGQSDSKRLRFDMAAALESDQRADVRFRFHCLIKAPSGGAGNIGGLRVRLQSNSSTNEVEADFMLDGTTATPAPTGATVGEVDYAWTFARSDGWLLCCAVMRPSTIASHILEQVDLLLLDVNGNQLWEASAGDALLVTDVDITLGRRAGVLSGRVIPEQGAILAVYADGPHTFPRVTSDGASASGDGSSRGIHFKRIASLPEADKLNFTPSDRAREMFTDPQNTWSYAEGTRQLTLNGLTDAVADIGGGRTITGIPFKLNAAPAIPVPIASVANERDCLRVLAHQEDGVNLLIVERVSESGGEQRTGGRQIVARRPVLPFTEWQNIVFLVDADRNEVSVEGVTVKMAAPFALWLGDPFISFPGDDLADSTPFSGTYSRTYDLANVSYGEVSGQAGIWGPQMDTKHAPNLLLNPGFKHDTLNEGSVYSVSTNNINVMDGWAVIDPGDTTLFASRQERAESAAQLIADGWRWHAKLEVDVSTNQNIFFGQDFADARRFAGKLLMLAFDINDNDLGTTEADYWPLEVHWRKSFGSGGLATATRTDLLTQFNIVKGARRYVTWLQIPRLLSTDVVDGDDSFCVLMLKLASGRTFDVRLGRADLYEGLGERIWTEPDPYLERARLLQLLRVYEADAESEVLLHGMVTSTDDARFLIDHHQMARVPDISLQGQVKIFHSGVTVEDLGDADATTGGVTNFTSELRFLAVAGAPFTANTPCRLASHDTVGQGNARIILDARLSNYG